MLQSNNKITVYWYIWWFKIRSTLHSVQLPDERKFRYFYQSEKEMSCRGNFKQSRKIFFSRPLYIITTRSIVFKKHREIQSSSVLIIYSKGISPVSYLFLIFSKIYYSLFLKNDSVLAKQNCIDKQEQTFSGSVFLIFVEMSNEGSNLMKGQQTLSGTSIFLTFIEMSKERPNLMSADTSWDDGSTWLCGTLESQNVRFVKVTFFLGKYCAPSLDDSKWTIPKQPRKYLISHWTKALFQAS